MKPPKHHSENQKSLCEQLMVSKFNSVDERTLIGTKRSIQKLRPDSSREPKTNLRSTQRRPMMNDVADSVRLSQKDEVLSSPDLEDL